MQAEKKMENNEKNIEQKRCTELSAEDMAKASGGSCFFGCDFELIQSGITRGEHTYHGYKCTKCGAEMYKKDGKEVPPSVFFHEAFGF
jgi:hypothetical protein